MTGAISYSNAEFYLTITKSRVFLSGSVSSPERPMTAESKIVADALRGAPGQRRPASGRQPEAGREMPREMALVGEAGRGRGFRQRHAVGDHALRARQTPSDLVAMRRGPGGGTEMAREREAVEAGDLLQLLRRHGALRLGGEELARARHRAMG